MLRVVVLLSLMAFVVADASPLYFFFNKMAANGVYDSQEHLHATAQKSARFLKCYLLQQSPFFWQRRFLTRRLRSYDINENC
ncbi:hypothetical protein QR680_015913 [Steinernema hermaphroditum]|uniref:Uncharacterized protein n=1 Tax=Steinernema hermaphroditum TaxID=289476 RepID=A0AA39LLP7_9BILA|nr:hypothetical protein QR680_015913 [Steinernema hermaphroditum]